MSSEAQALPAVGDAAPSFNLPADDGQVVGLESLRGTWVVLYFYPKDDTPGCTVEAQEFRDLAQAFEREGARVLGVSPDSQAKHCKFRDKFDLNFRLLCDTEHSTAERYGVWVEKSMYGRKYMGMQRATFIIDPKGKVVHVWPKVTPKGHAQQVLDALRNLKK